MSPFVIPAKAGIQGAICPAYEQVALDPASAGVTRFFRDRAFPGGRCGPGGPRSYFSASNISYVSPSGPRLSVKPAFCASFCIGTFSAMISPAISAVPWSRW
jgi:hypothetical protein